MQMRRSNQILPTVLHHGTSLTQFMRLRDALFVADGLYVGADRENITDHYAEQKAVADGSLPVTVSFDTSVLVASDLVRIEADVHRGLDGDIRQDGQWIITGEIGKAIIGVWVLNEDGEEVPLPLDGDGSDPSPFNLSL